MFTRTLTALAVVLALCPSASTANDQADDASVPTPLEVFEQRIVPIFKSPQPASCVQCHLAAVDLKDYILPSHEQTFASLRDQGLIDLDDPAKSKILTLIQMGEQDRDGGARLIHEQTRRREYEAFSAWIKACCSDPRLRALPKRSADELARPKQPDEVIRHGRKSRVLDSFVRNVWSQRLRCFPCHTPHELDESNPQHKLAIQRHKQFLEEFGAKFGPRLDIFRETPEATLQSLIEKSRNAPPGTLPLINLQEPAKSLLVLKPTSKLPAKNEQGGFVPPSYAEPVSHMGGLKMHVDDPSYKSFIAWIQDYARVVGGEYASVEDLPADNWYPSPHVLFVQDVPQDWPTAARIQVFVHAWNDRAQSWESAPVAFTQGPVAPRRNVAGTLFLFGQAGTDHAGRRDPQQARLAPGRYLLKAYLDSKDRLADDPTLLLGEQDFRGQAEVEARWGDGFPQAERIAGHVFD
ncbi:MAG TPA: hypothetical protein VML55_01550 [Planctomycetaceae bacterium]|nr:hypothetical protein [Planctomycetaceae bacterium]